MKINVNWLIPSRDIHLQPLHVDLRRVCTPKMLSHLPSKRVGNAQKLASYLKVHECGWDWIPTKSKAQNGHPVKGKDYILPTAQVKGTYISIKPLHQCLYYPMPHVIKRNPQKILEALLNQKSTITYIGPRIKQAMKEHGLSSPTVNHLNHLHLKS